MYHNKNFDSFIDSFIKCFELITLDNWFQNIFLKNSQLSFTKNFLFSISLIIIGNFIILNLFIANMLDGFENINNENVNFMVYEELENDFDNKINNMGEKLTKNDNLDSIITQSIQINHSLFIFSSNNAIIAKLKVFFESKTYIILNDILSVYIIILFSMETFFNNLDKKRATKFFYLSHAFVNLLLFTIFTLKIICYGLFFGQNTLLKNKMIIIDVLTSISFILLIMFDSFLFKVQIIIFK